MTIQKNSMDDIIVKYGQPQRTSGARMQAIFQKVVEEHISWEEAEESFKTKEISLPEFLKLKKENLSPDELKIQTVLRGIYSLNNETPPIYRSFPKREQPLVIDLTYMHPDKEVLGFYDQEENEIKFSSIKDQNLVKLVEVISHELKHAQQYIRNTENINNYQRHQLGFLQEAQANACEDRVLSLLCPEHPRAIDFNTALFLFSALGNKRDRKNGDIFTDFNLKNAEELRTLDYLHQFLVDKKFKNLYTYYKDSYDRNFPILKTDTPLTQIPPEFDILSPKRILEMLEVNVSKHARLPYNRAKQAMSNGDKKALSILLKSKDKNGNFLISDKFIFGVGMDALYIAEEKEAPELFETTLKSGRFSAKDISEFLGLIFHLSPGEKLTDKILTSKIKLLDILLNYRTPNGRKVISTTQINKALDEGKAGIILSKNDEYSKLVEHLENHINSTRTNITKRLKKHQISSPRKKRKLDTPEI